MKTYVILWSTRRSPRSSEAMPRRTRARCRGRSRGIVPHIDRAYTQHAIIAEIACRVPAVERRRELEALGL